MKFPRDIRLILNFSDGQRTIQSLSTGIRMRRRIICQSICCEFEIDVFVTYFCDELFPWIVNDDRVQFCIMELRIWHRPNFLLTASLLDSIFFDSLRRVSCWHDSLINTTSKKYACRIHYLFIDLEEDSVWHMTWSSFTRTDPETHSDFYWLKTLSMMWCTKFFWFSCDVLCIVVYKKCISVKSKNISESWHDMSD